MAQNDRLFLEDTCALLGQKLSQAIVEEKQIQEEDFQDFEVNYWVSMSEDSAKMTFAVRYPFLQEVLKAGSQALLERVWGDFFGALELSVESGTLSLGVKPAALQDEAQRQRCVEQLVNTRIWLLIGPLVERLRWLRDSTQTQKRNTTVTANAAIPPLLALQVRPLENCWIICKPDRILVVFTIHLDDDGDVMLGRAFCQEFAETGRKGSDSGLPCTFTEPKEPPSDLRNLQLTFTPNVGYLSLTLSDQCVRDATEERLYSLARPVMTFRNFFNFHLKNAKSYLHSRLRKALDRWQQTMNRAKRAPQNEKRRTMKGKVFVPNPR